MSRASSRITFATAPPHCLPPWTSPPAHVHGLPQGAYLAGAAAPLSHAPHTDLFLLAQPGGRLVRSHHFQRAIRRGSFTSVQDLARKIGCLRPALQVFESPFSGRLLPIPSCRSLDFVRVFPACRLDADGCRDLNFNFQLFAQPCECF